MHVCYAHGTAKESVVICREKEWYLSCQLKACAFVIRIVSFTQSHMKRRQITLYQKAILNVIRFQRLARLLNR